MLSSGFGKGLAVGVAVLMGVRAWQVFRRVCAEDEAVGGSENRRKLQRWGYLSSDAEVNEASEFRTWWEDDISPRRRSIKWTDAFAEYKENQRERRRQRRFNRDFEL